MAGEKGSSLAIATIGAMVGGITALALGKPGKSTVAMHWISPSGVSWHAIGVPAQKVFYLLSGNYIYAFLVAAIPNTMKEFSQKGKEGTPLVPEDYVFGGMLTDSRELNLPR
ncbi:MAG: hypothetical protein PHG61_00230 [Candidatus Marinimicrobia bacterium]|nr:hypothetical protein [Candidatus Neomarinimicrobiota bacterium]